MVVSVLHEYEVTPPQLSTMVVSVLYEYKVTPPQLSTLVASVFDKTSKIPPLFSGKKGKIERKQLRKRKIIKM